MLTPYGHLSYCTNIHAGESWDDHFRAIREHFPGIKKSVSPVKPMGIGLRLSNEASLELIKDDRLEEFREWLKDNDAYIFTMNGFPFGGFHHTVVKDNVHAPDWTTKDRTDYTIRLFNILKQLVPEGTDAGLSTSPLSYRYWFADEEETRKARETATQHIIDVAEKLIMIHGATGTTLHLDIEPEPDGLLETGEEFIQWFEKDFLPSAIKRIKEKFGATESKADELLRQHICLCYDICHFAVGYEPNRDMIARLKEKRIRIGKFQISAALKGMLDKTGNREDIRQAFARFNEPTYLHQVIARKKDGSLLRYRDLPPALEDISNKDVMEWRSHFHVPVSAEDFGLLESTRSDIEEVLEIQKQNKCTDQLEVETYTWEVLPGKLKIPVGESISHELAWVKKILVID